jgi:hypothetical protein
MFKLKGKIKMKSIVILAKSYTNNLGNSFFRYKIIIDGLHYTLSDIQPGYDSQYFFNAINFLKGKKLIPLDISYSSYHFSKIGINLYSEKFQVNTLKELKKWD